MTTFLLRFNFENRREKKQESMFVTVKAVSNAYNNVVLEVRLRSVGSARVRRKKSLTELS